MKSKNEKALLMEFKKVGNQITRWRNTRQKMEPMPEPIWQAAAQLADLSSVSRVATEFRLSHSALKGRCKRKQHRSPNSKARIGNTQSSFLEINPVLPVMDSLMSSSTVFEWSRQDGSRLTIRVNANKEQETKELAQTLVQMFR